MHRIARLQQDALFLSLLGQVESAEISRRFCRHGLPHLLDVARIAWIDALENGCCVEKPLVYAAALLHDLGRAAQYADPTQNHASAALQDCREILVRSGFDADEIQMILLAIVQHGDKAAPDDQLPLLSVLLRRADGLSRPCFHCDAAEECYWPAERRNLTVL